MGKGPKKQEYEATPEEKMSASVAMGDRNRFKRLYGPLQINMRDQSLSTDPTRQLRSRANADTMQALTSNLSFDSTQDIGAAGDVAAATVGQLGQAGAKGTAIQNQLRTNVLGTARGQAADAASGMVGAARGSVSRALGKASAKQQVRSARNAAAGQVAGTLMAQGISNMQTRGSMAPTDAQGNRLAGPPQPVQGSFFTPVNSQGQKALGIVNRLNQSGTFYDPDNPFSPYGGG